VSELAPRNGGHRSHILSVLIGIMTWALASRRLRRASIDRWRHKRFGLFSITELSLVSLTALRLLVR
jgi:hypothetical protein